MLSVIALADVPLVTFDGAAATTFKFVELNDPVMGGLSTGNWTVNNGFGVFEGEVKNVPSLKAPGFIKAAADGKFSDASSAAEGDLVLMVRSSTPTYKGFRVAFASGTMAPPYSCAGGGSIPFSRGCFKAKFSVQAGSDFAAVRIPFSAFSDKWSPATGEQTKTCAQDKDVCPTASKLSAIKRMEVWAEGADGEAHLEIQSITATLPSPASRTASDAYAVLTSRPPSQFDTCKAAVQSNLRYNISSRTTPDVPVSVDPGENLAEAVCCDVRTKVFAEPQFLFLAPDINLFGKLKADGSPTTFYDSVCGLPLFHAPVGRSFAEFKADTTEHGWPSFRGEEVLYKNIITNKTSGFVYSTCGTHLGSYLPDAKGSRWCMDLSCVSGNPPTATVEAAHV